MIVAHDLLATVAALLATFLLRFEGRELAERLDPWLLTWLLTGVVIYAGVVYFILGLHGPKWRFTSLLEFSRIVRAAAVLSISLLVLDYIILSPNFYGSFFFGKITIILYSVPGTMANGDGRELIAWVRSHLKVIQPNGFTIFKKNGLIII